MQHHISKYFISFATAVVILLFQYPVCISAQSGSQDKKWTFGVSAGALNSSLQSAEAIFIDTVNPFVLTDERPLSFGLSLRYYSNPTESIQLSLTNGKFSVFTDYQPWPEITFTNSFYQASLSYRLSLLRLLGVDPYPLDIYGSFGIGMIYNNTNFELGATFPSETVSGLSKKNISPVYTFGTGLSLQIGVIDIFTDYDFNISSSNIINELLISETINSDFTNTTNKWYGLRIGFQYTLRNRTKAPVREFQQPQQVPQTVISVSSSPPLAGLEEMFIKVSRPAPVLENLPEKSGISSILHQLNSIRLGGMIGNARSVYQYGQFEELQREAPRPPAYGLMGENTRPELPGFTLILHSLSSENAANTAANDLRKDGYMVFVIPIVVNNQTFYRVAVGQFENSTDALRAAGQLPPAYRNQNFIMALP